MRRNPVGKVLKIALFVIAGSAVFGFVVMSLWNWLVPALFGGHTITFLQALGLFLLSKILFGGFHGGRGRGQWRQHLRQRWEQMPPEEREKFRQGMRGRCGTFVPPAETQV